MTTTPRPANLPPPSAHPKALSNFSLILDFSPPLQSWVKPFGKGFNRLKNDESVFFRFRGIVLAGLCQYSETAPVKGFIQQV